MFRTGIIITFLAIVVGFLWGGGKFTILIQPTEWLIILGCGIGSFLVANPKFILLNLMKSLKKLKKQSPYSKNDYLQLLGFLFGFFN